VRQTFVFPASDSPAVQLVFGLRRGKLKPVEPPAGAQSTEVAFPDGRRGLLVSWKKRAPAAGAVVRLDVGEERAVVVDQTWAPPSAQVEPLFNGSTPGDIELSLAKPTQRAQILAWRDARAAAPHAADKRFFNQLERQTEVDEEGVWTAIDDLPDSVRRRALADDAVLARVRLGLRLRQREKSGSPYEKGPARPASESELEDLRAVSRIFRVCARELGPDAGPEALGLAFLRFATGNLMLLSDADRSAPPEVLDWKAKACQPNSALHFYFAEFADACLASKVDVEFWKPLYPALVFSLELFWKTYRQSELMPLPLGLPVAKLAPFTPPIAASTLAPALSGFEQRCGKRVADVHRKFVQWYLAPL